MPAYSCLSCNAATSGATYCDSCFMNMIGIQKNRDEYKEEQGRLQPYSVSSNSLIRPREGRYVCPQPGCSRQFAWSASVRRHLITKHGVDRSGKTVSRAQVTRERSHQYHRKEKDEALRPIYSPTTTPIAADLQTYRNRTVQTPYPSRLKADLCEIYDNSDSDDEKAIKYQEVLNDFWSAENKTPNPVHDAETAMRCQEVLDNYYANSERFSTMLREINNKGDNTTSDPEIGLQESCDYSDCCDENEKVAEFPIVRKKASPCGKKQTSEPSRKRRRRASHTPKQWIFY